MTIAEAISICNEMKPGNTFSDELKTRWLNEVEGQIAVKIHLAPVGVMETIAFSWPDDKDMELAIPLPYDRLYWLYLCAMVDFGNADFEKYRNSHEMYNDVLKDYRLWYITTQEPGKRPYMPRNRKEMVTDET